jgi:hypothetical protein
MPRTEPPVAQVHVRGVAGHLARAAAEAKQGLRVLGRGSLVVARVGCAIGAVGAIILWIATHATPVRPKIDRIDELAHRIQQLEQIRRNAHAFDAFQGVLLQERTAEMVRDDLRRMHAAGSAAPVR